jgi:hypothetical protein
MACYFQRLFFFQLKTIFKRKKGQKKKAIVQCERGKNARTERSGALYHPCIFMVGEPCAEPAYLCWLFCGFLLPGKQRDRSGFI